MGPESAIVTPVIVGPVTCPDIVQFDAQVGTVMLMVSWLVVAVLPSESVTFTVKLKTPATVGTALAIVPLVPSVKGFGSEPEARVNV